MHSVQLPRNEILSIRETGRGVKSKIDSMFFNRSPDDRNDWIKPKFILADTEAITRFESVAPFILAGSLAENYLEVRTNSEESLERGIALVSSNPQQIIKKIKIGLKIYMPFVFFEHLNRFLSEVQALTLRFENGNWLNREYMQWENLQMKTEFLLSHLPYLTDLTLLNWRDIMCTSRILELLIQRYGKQLLRFACDATGFLRIGLETCNEYLSSISHLNVSQGNNKELFQRLTSLHWPKLESLTLSAIGTFTRLSTSDS
ncbi:unnamed protein product [Orchesella dallaii]|uniref:Uncharacterized protein n=1 Tax=Orchesella dallaii TaxID=48710 RepID=A0ABP1RXW6_9HEXA